MFENNFAWSCFTIFSIWIIRHHFTYLSKDSLTRISKLCATIAQQLLSRKSKCMTQMGWVRAFIFLLNQAVFPNYIEKSYSQNIAYVLVCRTMRQEKIESKSIAKNIRNDWIAIWRAWMTTCKLQKLHHTHTHVDSFNECEVSFRWWNRANDVQEWTTLENVNSNTCTRILITIDEQRAWMFEWVKK